MPWVSDFRRRNIENQQNLILSLILLCAYLLLCDGWCQVNDFGSLRKPHIVFSCDGLRILIPAKWKNAVVVLCFHFHYRAMIFSSVLVALSLIYLHAPYNVAHHIHIWTAGGGKNSENAHRSRSWNTFWCQMKCVTQDEWMRKKENFWLMSTTKCADILNVCCVEGSPCYSQSLD